MIDHRLFRRLLLAAIVSGVVGAGHSARAQDDLEPEEEVQPQLPQQHVFVVNEPQFNQWAFGNAGNLDSVRDRLDSLLTLMIQDVDRTCGLSEAQKAKLRLAGRGDVKRFFDRVEEKRRKFQGTRHNQNDVGTIVQEIRTLGITLNAGLFGDDSFFSKTLRKTLSEEQAARYEEALRQKRQSRYRARVDSVVAMLGNTAGLSTRQRRRFAEVLLEETRPPRNYGRQDYYVVLLQAAKLPEAKIRPIFDDAQWRLLSRQFAQAKAMERNLKDNGYVPELDD
jgi:hypothetical protein